MKVSTRLLIDLIIPLIAIALLTVYFATNDRDLAIQESVFDTETSSWKLGEQGFWRFLYQFGTIPAAFTAIVAILIFIASFGVRSLKPFIRVSLFWFLLVAIASGLFANLVLKENWGRPRPRDVQQFGGRHNFEPVLTIDRSSDGKSFPCGHAVMGFNFLGAYFLLRRRNWWLGLIGLGAALTFGGLIGYARMLQGGHFASDVVWAAAISFFTAVGLYYLFGLHRKTADENMPHPASL